MLVTVLLAIVVGLGLLLNDSGAPEGGFDYRVVSLLTEVGEIQKRFIRNG